ncbi:hypothetical protein EKG37_09400 [Robertmurraya yapensis]|uniref:Uncharacterized protein n=2 Tax=Bacillaceae TaxID=186817 RepID=A0A3S0LCR4_9BACI|nr:hypothetical protein [Bacillus yapensis]RTR32370.1 hypothetical protein EKG37_09400 [Bacillus yapensis]TKS96564.1 hypothetical protein FAR12_09400 [Bacillus yapensis]
MSTYMLVLAIFVVVVIIFALGYTAAVAKSQRRLKGELDTAIPGRVQEGIFQKNPVFLTYLLFFVLVLLIILIAVLNW